MSLRRLGLRLAELLARTSVDAFSAESRGIAAIEKDRRDAVLSYIGKVGQTVTRRAFRLRALLVRCPAGTYRQSNLQLSKTTNLRSENPAKIIASSLILRSMSTTGSDLRNRRIR